MLPDDDQGMSTPAVDIVIPVHNQRARLATLLPALLALAPAVRVWLGDDASTDAPETILPGESRLRLIRLPRRRGPSAARAAAWAAGSAPYVLTLDSDATIDQPTLIALLALMMRHDRLAALQPVLRCPDGTLQNAGAAIRPDGSTTLLAAPTAAAPAILPVDTVCSACALWRREAVDEAGGWDTALRHYEDAELSWRLRRHDRQVALAPALTAQHESQPRTLRRFYWQEVSRRRMLRHNLTPAEWRARAPLLARRELFLLGWSAVRAVTDIHATRGASMLYPLAWLAGFFPPRP